MNKLARKPLSLSYLSVRSRCAGRILSVRQDLEIPTSAPDLLITESSEETDVLAQVRQL